MANKNIKLLEKQYHCIIPEKRQQTWNVQLEMWKYFDEFCKKHNIKYFFFWGALLGAVRHQGFVPWDDDIDVVMLREDYDKFSAVCGSEFQFPYYVQLAKNNTTEHYLHTKIIDERTTCINPFLRSKDNHQGMKLDIVPLDGIPQNKSTRTWQFICHEILAVLGYNHTFDFSKLSLKGKAAKLAGNIFFALYPYKNLAGKIEQLRSIAKTENCNMIGEMLHGAKFFKSDFDQIIYLDFEDYRVPVPSGYKRILNELYGDYMKLPPEWNRNFSPLELQGWIMDPNIPYQQYLEMLDKVRLNSGNKKTKRFQSWRNCQTG